MRGDGAMPFPSRSDRRVEKGVETREKAKVGWIVDRVPEGKGSLLPPNFLKLEKGGGVRRRSVTKGGGNAQGGGQFKAGCWIGGGGKRAKGSRPKKEGTKE